MRNTFFSLRFDRERLASWLFSFAIGVLLFGFLSGATSFWDVDYPKVVSALREWAVSASVLFLLSVILVAGRFLKLRIQTGGFVGVLVLLFFSEWLVRGYNLLQGPSIRGEILLCSLVAYWAFSRNYRNVFLLVLLTSVALFWYGFFQQSGGHLLFSDDHPAFFYRLTLLKEHFPFIPVYDTRWNGGADTLHLLATGAMGVYLLMWPLIESFALEDVYNILVALLLFGLLPGSTFFAARKEGLSIQVASISAVLALTTSLLWYRWGLKYGTLGFVVSVSLLPLNIILARRIISTNGALTCRELLLAFATFSLMLFWLPSGLVFLPALILCLFRFRSLCLRPRIFLLGVALFAFNAPWIYTFWSGWNVSQFMQAERPSYSAVHEAETRTLEIHIPRLGRTGIDFEEALQTLREVAISTNPLLLFLAIPGMFLLQKVSRRLFFATTVWLLLLGTLIAPFKPQLELDRMLVILGFVLTLPTAIAIDAFIREAWSNSQKRFSRIFSAFIVGLLCAGVLSTAGITRNRSFEQYFFMEDTVQELVSSIQEHTPKGRALFSGFVLHHLSYGHITPLTLFSTVPMIASSPYHNVWRYTQVFPPHFIGRKDQGIEEYLDLYNVTTVIAHEPIWREYFMARKKRYQRVSRHKSFFVFKRLGYTSDYFIEGRGEILEEGKGRILVRVDTKDVVLKFNYAPILKSSHCVLSGVDVGPSVNFIKLSDCAPGSTVEIRAISFLERLRRSVSGK